MLKKPQITTFYTERLNYSNTKKGFSESPDKPRRLMQYLAKNDLIKYFKIIDQFPPFEKEDFYLAHDREWVEEFFTGTGKLQRRSLLGIKWTGEYAESVRYTNASLYYAIRHSVLNPDEVSLSPTSGFHHATPKTGAFFCAFSGQVIASVRIYREFKISGCYIDLDGHWGNSIDNSYEFVPELKKAVPPEIGNINIKSKHGSYILELQEKLAVLKEYLLNDKIQYIVFCHGADSHEDDDLGSQLNTEEWIECSNMVYGFIKDMQESLKKQIPLILSLFGGYRAKNFDAVLELHKVDLVKCLDIICRVF